MDEPMELDLDGRDSLSSSQDMGHLGPPEIDPSEIELEDKIGEGSFGNVWRGRCRQKPVAVKILHKQNFDKKTLLAFRREVKIISKIFHPNICLFMGACLVPGKCMIVTELFPKGDLERLLRDPQVQLSMMMKMKMARDAALGVNWLHCSNPVFIHRDLKSSNLLVDDNMVVKVCDFGLSQLIPKDMKVRDKQNAKGTPLWMAPEVMMFEEFNEKCDVYSFGIVLWEIVTRSEPFSQFTSFQTFKEAICIKHVRPPIPADTIPSLRDLLQSSWHPDPSQRPSFKEIITQLNDIIVDCSVRDLEGRNFWRTNFREKEFVPWTEFLDKLSFFLYQDLNTADLEVKCLKALLAEPPKENMAQFTEVVNIEQFGKLLDWFGPLERNFMPMGITGQPKNSILERVAQLITKSWFHGDVSTAEAQIRLAGKPGGTFLVRFSTTHPGCYTISSLGQNSSSIKHQRVSYVAGRGFLFNEQYYSSLEQIIRDSDTLFIPCPGSKFQSLFTPTVPLFGYTEGPE